MDGSEATSVPATETWPSSAWMSVDTIRTNVVLPAPFGPSNATTSPARTSRFTPRSARTSPNECDTPRTRRTVSAMTARRRADEMGVPHRLDVSAGGTNVALERKNVDTAVVADDKRPTGEVTGRRRPFEQSIPATDEITGPHVNHLGDAERRRVERTRADHPRPRRPGRR